MAAGAVALLALRRGRGGARRTAGESERFLRTLAAALAVGIALAAALPGPEASLAAVGGGLLGAYLAAVLLGLLPLAAAGLLDTRDTAEWFIAVRYLVAKRRQTFISVITGICVVGIAAGVWLIITVLSVMNGFERTWRDEIIGNRAHLTVQHGFGPFADYGPVLERVESLPDVVAASPYLDAEGMVRGGAGEIMAVRVRGVDPARVGRVTDLREDLIAGSIDALAAPPEAEGADPGIVIGSQLAAAVGAQSGRSPAADLALRRAADAARSLAAPRALQGRRRLRIELLSVRRDVHLREPRGGAGIPAEPGRGGRDRGAHHRLLPLAGASARRSCRRSASRSTRATGRSSSRPSSRRSSRSGS